MEAFAFIQSITWAKENNYANIVIEADCATIINHINRPLDDITLIGHLLRQCQDLIQNFNFCNVNWCPRSCNKAANR